MPSGPPTCHPIQANFIAVREVRYCLFRPSLPGEVLEDSEVSITQIVSPYDDSKSSIQITLKAEFGFDREKDSSPPPYGISVTITGEFKVDQSRFPKEKVVAWAKGAAPFVLYPYLRQELHAATARSGGPSLILPLLEVPTVRIAQQEKLAPAQE